jgi:NAD-dependent DNA ligase
MQVSQEKLVVSLIDGERVLDLYVLARFMYRIGYQIVNDEFYDKLHQYCLKNNLGAEYTNRTYDDDPTPYTLLKEFELDQYIPSDIGSRNDFYQYLDEDKSLSIQPLTDYTTAFEFFNSVKGLDLMFSLKTDGINTKSLILEKEHKLSLSRGRSGNGFDLTDNIRKIIPRTYDTEVHELKVYSESYVDSNSLPYLREKYNRSDSYKTEKSSAVSMLRVEHDLEDYQHLKTLAFMADGLDTTVSGTMRKLEELGFSVVPHFLVNANEVPTEFNNFNEWLKEKLKIMQEMSAGIPSDGVVVEINDLMYSGEIKGSYSSRNIALKMEYWSFEYYKGTVTSIMYEQRRVWGSVRVKIAPTVARDNTEARVVNVYNPAMMFREDIRVGSEVPFERNSGAVNILISKDRLQKLELGSPDL